MAKATGTYPFARSKCTCGHRGDMVMGGSGSEHRGLMGHGSCVVPGCDCTKFTWKSFTPGFQEWLEKNRVKS